MDLYVVRMSELHPRHSVITTDRRDFRVYRRNKRDAIPLHARSELRGAETFPHRARPRERAVVWFPSRLSPARMLSMHLSNDSPLSSYILLILQTILYM